MSASLGSFLVCFCTVMFLTTYIYFIIHVKKDVLYSGMKFAFCAIGLILLRMLIPVNFPFTITISSVKILPVISRVLFGYIGNTHVGMAEIFLGIWGIVTIWKLIRLLVTEISVRNYLEVFRVQDISRYPKILKALEESGAPNFSVCIVPMRISPCISGLRKPVLVLPNFDFTERELYYICRHEVEHYRKHDLWLKLIVNLVTCVQWFNPVVYLLNRELTLAFELADDSLILKGCSEGECLEYADCLINLSGKLGEEKEGLCGIAFAKNKKSNLKVRIEYITERRHNTSKRSKISEIVCYGIISLVMVASFTFVPEAYEIAEAEQEETFNVSEENAYFIKRDSEYELYIADTYMTLFSDIPEEFYNIPVIEEELK